jgi:uncharacterized protein (TIGR01777 family)
MKYIIYGGSGFLGTEIVRKLIARGDDVVIADIRPPEDKNITFVKVNLLEEIEDNILLENPDVVINLAGKLIFGKWNNKFKDLIYSTRVDGTRNIVNSFKNEKYKPKFLINASAVGIYGDHGEEEINEDSSFGDSFLSKVAIEWEGEALKSKELGVNVRILRNAHILGKKGLLGVLLPYYKWFIGGPLGNGKQWMPWVHIGDVSDLYLNSSNNNFPEIINAVAPQPITNKELSKTIAKTVHRPHIFFIPKFALKVLYGEFSNEILVSQKIVSNYSIYEYKFSDIESAIKDILK